MLNFIKRRMLNDLRKDWPNLRTISRDNDSMSAYYIANRSLCNSGNVDDKTWHDLDMNSVFLSLDSTMTSIGQQYLYSQLRFLTDSVEELKNRFGVATRLLQNYKLREELQVALKDLGVGDASPVTKVLFSNAVLTSLPKKRIIVWATFSIALLLLFVFSSSPIWLLLLIIANFCLSRYFESKTDQANYTLSYFSCLITVAETIGMSRTSEDISAIRELQANRKEIAQLRKLLQLVAFSQNHESVIISNLMYLINLIFPYDWVVYCFSIDFMLRRRELLKKCYLSVGEIDSGISFASYLARKTRLCNPILEEGDSIELENITHPLVEDCIPNSVTLSRRSALITGSNMAGKTTFLKTLGINYLLSRTLWICHADRAKFPKFDIYTSIKTSDSLEDGKSFYFSELERIKLFLNRSEIRKSILIIDEIFRGTNTIERIAGAAAVIDELAQSNIVIVTTHDVELARLVKTSIDMWYFEETGNYKIPFDYKLKAGVCRTRNALKLMDGLGYPKHVIDRAVQLSKLVGGISSAHASSLESGILPL